MYSKLLKSVLLLALVSTFAISNAFAQLTVVTSKHELDANRVKIDSLDNQLIKILGERERIVKAIGIYKAKNHIAPLQAARFKEVVDKSIAAGNKEGLSPQFITELMNAIHKESLRIEGDTALTKR